MAWVRMGRWASLAWYLSRHHSQNYVRDCGMVVWTYQRSILPASMGRLRIKYDGCGAQGVFVRAMYGPVYTSSWDRTPIGMPVVWIVIGMLLRRGLYQKERGVATRLIGLLFPSIPTLKKLLRACTVRSLCRVSGCDKPLLIHECLP